MSSGNDTLVCGLDGQQSNIFWLTLVTVILNFILQIITGAVPNFHTVLDLFRPPEAKKSDTAQIKRSVSQVVEAVANLTPVSTARNQSKV
jgi:hypothetical protein